MEKFSVFLHFFMLGLFEVWSGVTWCFKNRIRGIITSVGALLGAMIVWALIASNGLAIGIFAVAIGYFYLIGLFLYWVLRTYDSFNQRGE